MRGPSTQLKARASMKAQSGCGMNQARVETVAISCLRKDMESHMAQELVSKDNRSCIRYFDTYKHELVTATCTHGQKRGKLGCPFARAGNARFTIPVKSIASTCTVVGEKRMRERLPLKAAKPPNSSHPTGFRAMLQP